MRLCAISLEAEMTREEGEYLQRLIAVEPPGNRYLEIGTGAGGTLWRMMACFPKGGRPRFVVVDPMRYFPNQMRIVSRNLEIHGIDPSEVDFRIEPSARALRRALEINEKFDFILIDGCHRILSVMGDLRWARLLNRGGCLCIHDYSHRFKGVQLAVDRFLLTNPFFERIGFAGSLLVLRRPDIANAPVAKVTMIDWLSAFLNSVPLHLERRGRRRVKGLRS